VKLDEIARPLRDYEHLTAFFTRRLREGARPVDPRPHVMVSPVDGAVVSVSADLQRKGVLSQVKGIDYHISDFLGIPAPPLRPGNALFSTVIYLSPGDYHRFHSPTEWRATSRTHFAGQLLPVNPLVAYVLPSLFCANERVAVFGEWEHGFYSYTAVGATNVGSIRLDFDPSVVTNTARHDWETTFNPLEAAGVYGNGFKARPRLAESKTYAEPVPLSRGDDIGLFELGSTIVLIFEAPADFKFSVRPGDKVRLGQSIGRRTDPAACGLAGADDEGCSTPGAASTTSCGGSAGAGAALASSSSSSASSSHLLPATPRSEASTLSDDDEDLAAASMAAHALGQSTPRPLVPVTGAGAARSSASATKAGAAKAGAGKSIRLHPVAPAASTATSSSASRTVVEAAAAALLSPRASDDPAAAGVAPSSSGGGRRRKSSSSSSGSGAPAARQRSNSAFAVLEGSGLAAAEGDGVAGLATEADPLPAAQLRRIVVESSGRGRSGTVVSLSGVAPAASPPTTSSTAAAPVAAEAAATGLEDDEDDFHSCCSWDFHEGEDGLVFLGGKQPQQEEEVVGAAGRKVGTAVPSSSVPGKQPQQQVVAAEAPLVSRKVAGPLDRMVNIATKALAIDA
jgi:phosphatidylserine decarboxylase precursor